MKRFFFSDRHPRATAIHFTPRVEELESRRLLAVASAGSVLPAAQAPTLGQGLTARLSNNLPQSTNNLPQAQLSTVGLATTPGKTGAATTFFLPATFFSPGAGLATGLPLASPLSATTGALLPPTGLPFSSTASINALTPQQALAQRAVISTVPPPPPPVYAYGEGMIINVAPLELSPPGPNNPVTTTDTGAVVNLAAQPAESESIPTQQASPEWQDALDAYYAEVGVR